MQSVLSRIWTRVAVSISYDDNDYTTVSLLIEQLVSHFGHGGGSLQEAYSVLVTMKEA